MKKAVVKEPYSILLEMGGEAEEHEAPTIFEALALLKPRVVKSRGNITARKGALKSELSFRPFQLKRLLMSKFMKEIVAKRLEMALK